MPRADQLFKEDSKLLNCMVHKDPSMENLTWELVAIGKLMSGLAITTGSYNIKLYGTTKNLYMGLDRTLVDETYRDMNSNYVIATESTQSW